MIHLKEDIFLTPLWTRERCEEIISKANEHGDFSPAVPGDTYRTQDVVLSSTDNPMLARLCLQIEEEIFYEHEQDIRDEWMINRLTVVEYHIFIVKYMMGVQENLALHSDESDITISVKLNDDYEGCELYFPRQDYTNVNVPVGQALVFPGGVTHPHQALDLMSGIKYILNAWCTVR